VVLIKSETAKDFVTIFLVATNSIEITINYAFGMIVRIHCSLEKKESVYFVQHNNTEVRMESAYGKIVLKNSIEIIHKSVFGTHVRRKNIEIIRRINVFGRHNAYRMK
jgi:hypothetical protein